MAYAIGPLDFAEDHLPPDQPVIMTSNVIGFLAYMFMLTTSVKRYPIMGAVVGPPGLGKTIAVVHYVDDLPVLAHTRWPSGVRCRLKKGTTGREMLRDIITAMGEIPRGRTRYDLFDEVVAAIQRNCIDLLIIDEADRLTTETFDLLRDIFDKTGCTIVLVGLPDLLNVTRKHPKFHSRMAVPMTFEPFSEKEILETILPGLVFPCWSFDPSNKEDLAMGRSIFRMVGSSLRQVRNLLETASRIAQDEGTARITIRTITEAKEIILGRSRATKGEERQTAAYSEYEDISERRRDVKEGRRRGGDE
jgi:DNA transposition AAA+ family ATPase